MISWHYCWSEYQISLIPTMSLVFSDRVMHSELQRRLFRPFFSVHAKSLDLDTLFSVRSTLDSRLFDCFRYPGCDGDKRGTDQHISNCRSFSVAVHPTLDYGIDRWCRNTAGGSAKSRAVLVMLMVLAVQLHVCKVDATFSPGSPLILRDSLDK